MINLNFAVVKKVVFPKQEKEIIKVWQRSLLITESLLGRILAIHNGKGFVNILISPKMLNKKLGEFSLTRKYPKHPVKEKNIKKNKKK